MQESADQDPSQSPKQKEGTRVPTLHVHFLASDADCCATGQTRSNKDPFWSKVSDTWVEPCWPSTGLGWLHPAWWSGLY